MIDSSANEKITYCQYWIYKNLWLSIFLFNLRLVCMLQHVILVINFILEVGVHKSPGYLQQVVHLGSLHSEPQQEILLSVLELVQKLVALEIQNLLELLLVVSSLSLHPGLLLLTQFVGIFISKVEADVHVINISPRSFDSIKFSEDLLLILL